MDLKVLGCHGGETPKHRTSSFLVDNRLALDAGALTGTLSLREQQQIQSVLVSHAHLDHVRDLATLADSRCQQGGPTLEVVGTEETVNTLKTHFFNGLLWPDFTNIVASDSDGPTVRFRVVAPEQQVEVAGFLVTPVPVTHTIDTSGFLVSDGDATVAYSGDTGPTERFWQVLNQTADLRAVLLEVSFPKDQSNVARASGHHTPDTVARELKKLAPTHAELPVLLFHIKPVFEQQVERELAAIKKANLTLLQLDDQFVF